jgi:serine protease inhibitor
VWKRIFGKRRFAILSIGLITVILVSYLTLVYYQNNLLSSVYAVSDEKADSVDARLVSANTKFAFNLFKELIAEDANENVFISPLSIQTALAMTYDGAEGTTKDAMAKTLNFEDMTLEEINQAYSDLMESLENVDQAADLLFGNSVWIRNWFEPLVKSSFLERVGASFNGEVFTRDFESLETIDEINGWVDGRTEGKVTEIVQQIEPDLVMLLINAIYFKGDWKIAFDEAQTQQQDFFLSDGNTVKVDMMTTSGEFSYYSGETCRVARLPYGRDKVAMYIFVPNDGISLDSFIANLNQTSHDEYISRLNPIDDLIVSLPKFEVEYGVKRLNNVLKKMGMEIVFDPFGADFDGIASTASAGLPPLYVSYVDHKAIVEVNEKGTEAAAATSVGMSLMSAQPSFVVDSPFFYEIRDDRSGSILFMGETLNPARTSNSFS